MLRIFLIVLGLIIVIGAITAFAITRDGKPIVPEGLGTVTTDAGTFEAFPLPEYAAAVVSEDYKSYFVEVEPGIKIHVLEVGSGYPVYMQHGNPTSGLLYRKVAAALPTDRVRLIMPTMVGLGFSSKVPASEHQLENHMRWMNTALDQLDLKEAIYVGQDWGGAVGMGALMQSPEIIQGAVVLNTAFTSPREPLDISRAHAMVKTPVIGELMLEVLFPIFYQLQDVQGDPDSFNKEVADLYGLPVLESGNGKAPVALMRMVPDGPDHRTAAPMLEIETYVKSLDIPVEIVWGMSDPMFARALPVMEDLFPNAPVTQTEAGHFLQEEVPQEIASAIMRVIDQVRPETDIVSLEEVSSDN
ncbi:MAG: alpha/beta fold hydrolase [Pseudomonadota bacterium]